MLWYLVTQHYTFVYGTPTVFRNQHKTKYFAFQSEKNKERAYERENRGSDIPRVIDTNI